MRPEELHDRLREYWDEDAATYDRGPGHAAHTPAQRAAWTATLKRLLPPPPARVLDAGAGTGFLSLPLARLGYEVTAIDLSTRMLAQLHARADADDLEIAIVEAPAESPPAGPFDVVVERHLLWTVADPVAALAAWREVAPSGRLSSFGAVWGPSDKLEIWRERARNKLHRLERRPPEHHAPYEQELVESLPFQGGGVPPNEVVAAVEAAGWRRPALERLRDVEWARSLALGSLERLIGVAREFAVTAEAPGA